ncbi:MAG TPA: TIR domain-containing protein, partial [Pseudonocardiaceae bacterium]|nr:TIR domain-containing protein [Pseudonocardiaceae bacterium]
MARVFISYASEDIVLAREVRRWLDDDHHEVFLAQGLREGIGAGERWRSRLHERLRWADAVVCVVTSSYVASPWCAAEVGAALSWGSRLVPVLAESGVVHPPLSDLQHLDLTRDPATVPARLAEALRLVDAAGGWGWPDDWSPFPGLRPFEVGEHRVFFGREGETKELAELLRSPLEQAKAAVLLVVGPSGCGKSSLVRAGLVHVMAQKPGWWTLPPILPGADPMASLARELATAAQQLGVDWDVAQVRQRLDTAGLTEVTNELLLAAPGQRRRLLIVVDQFEELLTQTGPTQRARFAALLHPALSGPVQLVATLRPEFLTQLLVDTELSPLPTRTCTVRPLHREGLRRVIEGPAQLAGLGADNDLVTQLVDDTGTGEALPLLAFTLAQLAEGLRRGDQLSTRRYEQLGGVRGALTRQADAALAEAMRASGRSHEQVIAGLLGLVTVDEQGNPTRWRVSRDELPNQVATEWDAFIARRLLITDTATDNGKVVVGLANEAFLSAWPPLAEAITAAESALRARRAVEQAATGWNDDGRPSDRLWERGQLAAAVADTAVRYCRAPGQATSLATRGPLPWWVRRNWLLASDRVELSPTARDFLHASIRRDRFRRQRAVTVLSVLLALALVASVLAVTQQHAAERQRDVAVSRQAAGQALELRATNPALAAQLSLAAYQLVPTTEARGSLLSIAADPYATRLTGHTTGLTRVAFSPDGHTLATASVDKTVRLWEVSNPHQPRPLSTLTDHTAEIWSVAFSPDGQTLATGSDDGTVRLWDVSDARQPHPLSTLTGHTNIVRGVAFSPDGQTLATGSDDTTVRLWDVSDLRQPHPLSTLT